jgi:hypothetical protein
MRTVCSHSSRRSNTLNGLYFSRFIHVYESRSLLTSASREVIALLYDLRASLRAGWTGLQLRGDRPTSYQAVEDVLREFT